MGVGEIERFLKQWQMEVKDLTPIHRRDERRGVVKG